MIVKVRKTRLSMYMLSMYIFYVVLVVSVTGDVWCSGVFVFLFPWLSLIGISWCVREIQLADIVKEFVDAHHCNLGKNKLGHE